MRGAESLCKLLRYLAEHSLAHPPSTVKEYQIATEVFGRPAQFDPHTDSTVRVQAGRLRAKLSEYYATEGADDPLIVRLPKGSYHLSFEPNPSHGLADAPHGVLQTFPDRTGIKYWRLAVLVLSLGLLGSIASLAGLLWRGKVASPVVADPGAGNPALRSFWKPFLGDPEPPLVIFSNAAFVGRPESGLRYFNPGRDANATIHDHYTGVGEVLAVHALDEVFGSLGQRVRVKRGSLFSLDDAKHTNLVFVGSPSENLTLLDIPGTQEFVFRRMASGPRKGDLAVMNEHPQNGEQSAYLASPSNDPLTEDYAVIGLVPGLDPAHYILILAGTTTFGTQGAVEFVSRPDSLEKLLPEIAKAANGEIKPFEALVRVKVARGVPVESELVAVRSR